MRIQCVTQSYAEKIKETQLAIKEVGFSWVNATHTKHWVHDRAKLANQPNCFRQFSIRHLRKNVSGHDFGHFSHRKVFVSCIRHRMAVGPENFSNNAYNEQQIDISCSVTYSNAGFHSLVIQIKHFLIVGHLIDKLIPVHGTQSFHTVCGSRRIQFVPNRIIV